MADPRKIELRTPYRLFYANWGSDVCPGPNCYGEGRVCYYHEDLEEEDG